MHSPEIVSFDSNRLWRICQHHSGGSCRIPNHTRGQCTIQRLATINQKVRIVNFDHKCQCMRTKQNKTNTFHWQNNLQFVYRSKSCKKDLWAQINAALQTNSKWQRLDSVNSEANTTTAVVAHIHNQSNSGAHSHTHSHQLQTHNHQLDDTKNHWLNSSAWEFIQDTHAQVGMTCDIKRIHRRTLVANNSIIIYLPCA